MENNNKINIKLISNFIYYLSIFIITLLYISKINNSHLLDKKGFIISYILGIITIIFFTYIYIVFTKKKNNLKKDNNKLKFKGTNIIIFIFFILIYVIFCIHFIHYPLSSLRFSNGLINIVKYSNKILLISGISIPINFIISFSENIKSNQVFFQNTLKLIIFTILGIFITIYFKYKGLLYLITSLEFIHLISTILLNEINQKNNSKKLNKNKI